MFFKRDLSKLFSRIFLITNDLLKHSFGIVFLGDVKINSAFRKNLSTTLKNKDLECQKALILSRKILLRKKRDSTTTCLTSGNTIPEKLYNKNRPQSKMLLRIFWK